VQQELDRWCGPGLESEELAVEHVREPRERMPVAGVPVVKAQTSPSRLRPGARSCSGDVVLVVVVEES